MHIEDLRYLHHNYSHVYLSPHLDDAALSCGGAISAALGRGESVLVVTLCTAAPPPEGPFNAVAREFHADWGLAAADVMAVRLSEERLAMERLGCDYYWAGMLDAIYRVPEAYDSRATLFAEPRHDDPLHVRLRELLAALRHRLPQARFYGPLGVGNHVDHLITYAAALATPGPAPAFYEDFHYVLQPGALEARLAAVSERFVPQVMMFGEAALARRIDAIAAYGSQVGELFGGVEPMTRAITEYSAALAPAGGYGERLWEPG
jgi:LmbE family N-acetylglucosaminyl deacetylase